jgi:hypothetical protein
LGSFLTSGHKRSKLVAFEKSRNLTVGEERIHTFQEARVEDIGLIHNEADLLTLNTTSSEDISEIVVKVLGCVLAMNLDLEHLETTGPSNKARERSLATSTDTDEDKIP